MAVPKGSILITGANGGLGSAIVSRIVSSDLGKDYHGIYIVRNPKTAYILNDILERPKAESHGHDTIAMDLSSLENVRKAAADIGNRIAEGRLPRLRALILNAAYQDSTELHMTNDGFEITFQINYLSRLLAHAAVAGEHGPRARSDHHHRQLVARVGYQLCIPNLTSLHN